VTFLFCYSISGVREFSFELLKFACANSIVPYESKMLRPLAIGRQQNYLEHNQIWSEINENFWDYLLVWNFFWVKLGIFLPSYLITKGGGGLHSDVPNCFGTSLAIGKFYSDLTKLIVETRIGLKFASLPNTCFKKSLFHSKFGILSMQFCWHRTSNLFWILAVLRTRENGWNF
jgi:hypothetical protein